MWKTKTGIPSNICHSCNKDILSKTEVWFLLFTRNYNLEITSRFEMFQNFSYKLTQENLRHFITNSAASTHWDNVISEQCYNTQY